MGKKDTGLGEAIATPARLTPLDVQQKEFRVSRFGGYKMRDVDEFLDQITDTFTALTGEIERLRTGGAAPVVGAPDLDDVARQADEIIARARAEATRITAEARAAGAAGAIGAAPDRSAVAAFIDRERSFLQSLAGLVQEHAETVKGMAKSARQAPATPARAERAPTSPASTTTGAHGRPAVAPVASDVEAPTPRSSTRRASEPTSEPTTESSAEQPPTQVPESEATVRIEEPARAVASRTDGEGDGDRSLRDLFWGED